MIPSETTPANAKPIVVAIERIECPTCEGQLGTKDVRNDYDDHPTLHTVRRTVHIDCPYCGDTHVAALSLQGGVWVTDTLDTKAYKRSA